MALRIVLFRLNWVELLKIYKDCDDESERVVFGGRFLPPSAKMTNVLYRRDINVTKKKPSNKYHKHDAVKRASV